jgi:hypothetical protein
MVRAETAGTLARIAAETDAAVEQQAAPIGLLPGRSPPARSGCARRRPGRSPPPRPQPSRAKGNRTRPETVVRASRAPLRELVSSSRLVVIVSGAVPRSSRVSSRAGEAGPLAGVFGSRDEVRAQR